MFKECSKNAERVVQEFTRELLFTSLLEKTRLSRSHCQKPILGNYNKKKQHNQRQSIQNAGINPCIQN